jgi:undecaprenyl-diphosphatase
VSPVRTDLHVTPPFTPAGLLLRRRGLGVAVLIVVFSIAAMAAALNDAALLRVWDEPITNWVRSHRTDTLDRLAGYGSDPGNLEVAMVGLVVLLTAVAWRCRALALTLALAVLAKPIVETILKYAIDRDRPVLDPLPSGHGPSFPSGHVLAAVALWGLLPPVVALLSARRVWWWLSVAVSTIAIGAVAASRLYLGMHWFSDIVGALIFGALYLVAVEWILVRQHRRWPCPEERLLAEPAPEPQPAAV